MKSGHGLNKFGVYCCVEIWRFLSNHSSDDYDYDTSSWHNYERECDGFDILSDMFSKKHIMSAGGTTMFPYYHAEQRSAWIGGCQLRFWSLCLQHDLTMMKPPTRRRIPMNQSVFRTCQGFVVATLTLVRQTPRESPIFSNGKSWVLPYTLKKCRKPFKIPLHPEIFRNRSLNWNGPFRFGLFLSAH